MSGIARTRASESTAGAADAPAIALESVTFAYGAASKPAVEDVTLAVNRRDLVVIVGPNGGGKTTLLKLVLGLLDPQHGAVSVLGRPPRSTRSHIGYVPQRREIDSAAPATVLDVVLTGRLARSRWGFRYARRDGRKAMEALERLEAADLAKRRMASLSGGQRQRVLIARALAGDASLLLLDEPEAGIDARASERLGELLVRLNDDLPIVVVSHHAGFIRSARKRVARLDRRLEWLGSGVDGENGHDHAAHAHGGGC